MSHPSENSKCLYMWTSALVNQATNFQYIQIWDEAWQHIFKGFEVSLTSKKFKKCCFTVWPLKCIFLKRFYLFIFRGRGKEGEREGEKHRCVREISMCGWLLHTPNWGPGLQPRHMPWRGIELATFWSAGWCSIHWATPARAQMYFLQEKTCKGKLWLKPSFLGMLV